MKLQTPVPILRIFDYALAIRCYVDWLGFKVDWEHQFDGKGPRYMQISRDAAVLHLTEQKQEAYGSAIRSQIESRTGRAVPRGSIYITLDRLEEKGLLASHEGRATAARGNRPKRIFKVTPPGVRAVKASVGTLIRMHRGLETVLGRL